MTQADIELDLIPINAAEIKFYNFQLGSLFIAASL